MALVNINGVLTPASGNLLAKAENIAYSIKTVGSGFSASEEIDKSVKDTLDENSQVMAGFNNRLTIIETALNDVVIDNDKDATGVSILALSNKVSQFETKVNSLIVELTLEEYDALGDNELQGVLYLIKKNLELTE